jgi:hypothetical protein
MPGETNDSADAQALWDSVITEREEAGEAQNFDLTATDPPEDTAGAADPVTIDPPITAPTVIATPDPFKALSPEVMATLDQLRRSVAEIPGLVQQVNTANGRVAAIQRDMDLAKAAAKTVTVAPTEAQMAAAKASTQKWDTLKEDFPDWADATEEYVQTRLAGLPAAPEAVPQLDADKIDAAIEAGMGRVRKDTAQLIEFARVEGKYEDWRDVIASPDFLNWRAIQKPEVEALASSVRGRDAIRMLDLFHADKATSDAAALVVANKAAKLAAATSTRPGTQRVAEAPDDLNPADAWNHELVASRKRGKVMGLTY